MVNESRKRRSEFTNMNVSFDTNHSDAENNGNPNYHDETIFTVRSEDLGSRALMSLVNIF
jgi:hypothetical protein